MGDGSQARAGKCPQQPASLGSGQPGPAPRSCQQRALRPGPPKQDLLLRAPKSGPTASPSARPSPGRCHLGPRAGGCGIPGREARAPGFPEKSLGLGWGSAWLGAQAPGLRTSRSGEELGGREAGTPGFLAGRGPVEQRDWRLLRFRIGCAARPLAQRDPMLASGGRKLVLMLPSVGVAGMRRREQPP